MEKEFIPYEIALTLKELGFDEPCFAYYNNHSPRNNHQRGFIISQHSIQDHNEENEGDDLICSAPTFSQAFRWFREKYKNLHGSIEQTNSYKDEYTVYIGRFGYIEGNLKDEPKVFISYEEAELECFKKLIEIVKNNK